MAVETSHFLNETTGNGMAVNCQWCHYCFTYCHAMAVSSNPRVLKQNKNAKKTKAKSINLPIVSVDKKKLLAIEIKFIKKLAGNDKTLSEKELKKLRKWLQLRSNSSNPFSDEDLKHLWKGLYYCMWMSDKPVIQEHLAENLASLLHCFDKKEVSIQFFGAFLKCMGREWFTIDQCRIDKFMMLVRRVTRQCFVVLKDTKWDKKLIKQLNGYTEKCILDKSTSLGFLMHFTEVFLEEIAKVSAGKISKSKVTLLIQPFAMCVAMQRDHKVVGHITKHIFDGLLYQSDLGREYQEKFEAWRRMGFPGTSIDDLELETEDEEEEVEEKEETADDSEDENSESMVSSHLDPRAGRVDVIMPEIPFDPVEIIKILEQFKLQRYTNVKGRRILKKLIERYSIFATGKFPLGMNYMKINEKQVDMPNIDNKVQELIDFEDELLHSTKEIKKMNKKKRKKTLTHTEVQPKKVKLLRQDELKQKKKKLVNSWVETDLTPDEIPVNVSKTVDIPVTPTKTSINGSSCTSTETEILINSTTGPFTVNVGWDVPLQKGEEEYFVPAKKTEQRINEANEKLLNSYEYKTNLVPNPIAIHKKQKLLSSPTTPTVPQMASTPRTSEKKVKIMLDLNRSQDTNEYIRQLRSSPNIPYDSSKKPGKGLLKPNLVPSPINPFYKKKLGLEF